VGVAANELAAKQDQPDRVFMVMTEAELAGRLQADPQLDIDTIAPADLGQGVSDRADAAYPPNSPPDQVALRERVKALAVAITHVAADPPDRALVTVRVTTRSGWSSARR
jgi:hypothetical protein